MAVVNIKRQYYQGKLIAYMKKNESVLRYKLCRIEEKYLTSNYRIKPNNPLGNYNELNKGIDELERKIDITISKLLAENPKLKITNKVLDDAFNLEEHINDSVDENEGKQILLYDFDQYINKKREEKRKEDLEKGIERKLHPTIKDYISTRNSIDDYEHSTNQMLYLNDVTEDFLIEYIDFLIDERTDTEEYKNKTEGGLENSTINKRLDCLATFVRAFYKDYGKGDLITSCKLEKIQKDIIRLSKDELIGFADMNLKRNWEMQIRDYFVFICLTGIRFSDLTAISKKNFVKDSEGYVLKLYTHKTVKWAEIPLTERAYTLAERNGFEFKKYTNQAFNREIKELFKRYQMFEDEIVTHRKIKRKIVEDVKLKRDCISAHTGRRTFISILVENGVPISRVMGMTGHTKETTLRVYIDKFSPDLRKSIEPLNF